MIKPTIKAMPSGAEKKLSEITYHAAIEISINIGISRFNVDDDTNKGLNRAVIPKTSKMFVIFEPIAFPTAVFVLSAKAAEADTIISGADDPIATMVKPTISVGTPRFLAIAAAPYTNLSALQTNATKAISKMILGKIIGVNMVS